MKQLLILLVAVTLSAATQAQQQALAPDQNPSYLQSQHKYMGIKDSLLETSNTTVQETYKAYDFYEARQERRALRRENRNNLRQIRAENSWNPGYYNNYNSGYNGWYGYSPFNNFYNSGFFPRVGFRTGNWRFNW
jgi:opacity protein-like surface antigen